MKYKTRYNKIKKLCFLTLVVFTMTAEQGCESQELEDRCFPMMALADMSTNGEKIVFGYTFPSPRRTEDQGDDTKEVDTAFAGGRDFVSAWENYEERLDKKPDDNHLKVLVLGERLIKSRDQYKRMLEFMEERESFPRNACVCVTPDCRRILQIQGKLSDDAGNYLEAYLKNNKNSGIYGTVTLGMLMDELANRKKELFLPYIRVLDGGIMWDGVYPVRKGFPARVLLPFNSLNEA